MVSFTVSIDETKPAMIEIATAYGKYIDAPDGGELKVCEHGTGFEAKVAERMLIGAMQSVRIRTTMLIHRDGGRLELFNDPQELNSSD
jgi:hypothetical protein